ncbi:hypothetical protein BY996DRAFT_6412678 [Phakopsora pachyrhizi]|nr:hypothetical protein BY996DRAFT_6412678 [Phakopsora pachyrhizi]
MVGVVSMGPFDGAVLLIASARFSSSSIIITIISGINKIITTADLAAIIYTSSTSYDGLRISTSSVSISGRTSISISSSRSSSKGSRIDPVLNEIVRDDDRWLVITIIVITKTEDEIESGTLLLLERMSSVVQLVVSGVDWLGRTRSGEESSPSTGDGMILMGYSGLRMFGLRLRGEAPLGMVMVPPTALPVPQTLLLLQIITHHHRTGWAIEDGLRLIVMMWLGNQELIRRVLIGYSRLNYDDERMMRFIAGEIEEHRRQWRSQREGEIGEQESKKGLVDEAIGMKIENYVLSD